MSNKRFISWNPFKKKYDTVLFLSFLLYSILFIFITAYFEKDQSISQEVLLIRLLGGFPYILLHVILSIGPLCRLSPKFLPLLYNRRHLGVFMFFTAFIHGLFSLVWYHMFGIDVPGALLFDEAYEVPFLFPFEVYGLASLIILFLMALTSHDFWLKTLTPGVWKGLHMLVYVAYAFAVAHLYFGILQTEKDFLHYSLTFAGFLWLCFLHLTVGVIQLRKDKRGMISGEKVNIGGVDEIPPNRAKTVTLKNGEKIAVFRYDNKISAVESKCRHQQGPIGEGKVINGCIVFPWHGYQYHPHNGTSPPPFNEKLKTFRVSVENNDVYVFTKALPAGTPVEPATF